MIFDDESVTAAAQALNADFFVGVVIAIVLVSVVFWVFA